MADENVEAEEHAADLNWEIASADMTMVERGYPVADIVEEDNHG